MPPCAATVWLRVGNTLVMQAVFRPFSAHAHGRAQARSAGADDHRVIDMVDDLVGFRHQDWRLRRQAGDLEDREDGERSAADRIEIEQHDRHDAAEIVLIILDHDLQAEAQMIEDRDGREDQRRR
jgi:hypothetical protein